MFDPMHAMRTRIITQPGVRRATGSSARSCSSRRWTARSRARDTAELPVGRQARRAVPQGRQGPRRRGRRRAADEADRPASTTCWRGPTARACSARRCARSIKHADEHGIDAVVDQQFEVGEQILGAGLVPIIEPEVDIHSPQKAEAEALLQGAILAAPRCTARRRDGDAQADDSRRGRPLRRPGRAPEGAARRGAVRRLLARRGQRAPRAQPGHDRQLLAGAHRGPDRAAERRRVRRRARRRRSRSIFEASKA